MKRLLSAIAFLAAATAAPAFTQPADNSPPQPNLTRSRALERADQLFDRFDLNHDGIVTRDEAERLGRKLMLQRAASGRDPAHGLGGHTLRFLKHRFAAWTACAGSSSRKPCSSISTRWTSTTMGFSLTPSA